MCPHGQKGNVLWLFVCLFVIWKSFQLVLCDLLYASVCIGMHVCVVVVVFCFSFGLRADNIILREYEEKFHYRHGMRLVVIWELELVTEFYGKYVEHITKHFYIYTAYYKEMFVDI